jgi:predicted RNase H-like HicB family nuclease
MYELIFEVREDDIDGGYVASALGAGIHTEAETIDGLKRNLREALACHFDDPADMPRIVRLHFVRDEVLAP